MKRHFDILLSLAVLPFIILSILIISIIIKLTSHGPILHWSDRIGRDNKIFKMPKFRTMRHDAPIVATHLLDNPPHWITGFGKILRKTSLDELPQIWSIIIGDMSFVGPRPALFNQNDLIELRTAKNIHTLVPGLTGWAQVHGRDNITLTEKTNLDEYYLNNQSLMLDIYILAITIVKVFRREDVDH